MSLENILQGTELRLHCVDVVLPPLVVNLQMFYLILSLLLSLLLPLPALLHGDGILGFLSWGMVLLRCHLDGGGGWFVNWDIRTVYIGREVLRQAK